MALWGQSSREGIGLRIPERNPAHEHPQWFELDLDDQIEDPDEPFVDPLPTERHRRVPGDELMAITTDRDKVRLLIGDTDETDPLLYDDEIEACLAQRALVASTGGTTYNVVAAAADACGAIAAKFGRQFSFTEDGQNFQRAQRVGHYQALERQLRARQGGVSVPVSLAGTALI